MEKTWLFIFAAVLILQALGVDVLGMLHSSLQPVLDGFGQWLNNQLTGLV